MTFDTILFGSLMSFIVEELVIFGLLLAHALYGCIPRMLRVRVIPRTIALVVVLFYFLAVLNAVTVFTRLEILGELSGGTRQARSLATFGFWIALHLLWEYDNWNTVKTIQNHGDSPNILQHVRKITVTPLARIGIKRSVAAEELIRRFVQLTGILAVVAFIRFLESKL